MGWGPHALLPCAAPPACADELLQRMPAAVLHPQPALPCPVAFSFGGDLSRPARALQATSVKQMTIQPSLLVPQEVEKQYREGTLKAHIVAVLKAVQPEALTVQGEAGQPLLGSLLLRSTAACMAVASQPLAEGAWRHLLPTCENADCVVRRLC